jgi:hypothetical protein
VDAAADQQVPGQGSGSWMVDRLVGLELVVPRARLEEEVVGEVADQIAGGV